MQKIPEPELKINSEEDFERKKVVKKTDESEPATEKRLLESGTLNSSKESGLDAENVERIMKLQLA